MPAPLDKTPDSPRVAVIVPAYGVAHLLAEALESVRAQTLTEWECLVIDDGAPDDVAGAVAPFLADPRFRFLQTDNKGLAGARNRAIRAARAPCLALLDGDDLFRPEYLAHTVAALDADPAARVATCNARVFGAIERERLCVDRRQGHGDGITGSLADVIDRSFNVYIGSTFRRADFDVVGGFDESFTHCEDLDFWIRLLMLGGHARYIDAILAEYRVRPGSMSGDPAKMIAGNLKAYRKAAARLGETAEGALVQQMIARNEAELAYVQALHTVADGDVRALPTLRALRNADPDARRPVWSLAFAMWRLAPALAPPMLRWRQRHNARGAGGSHVPPLALGQPAP